MGVGAEAGVGGIDPEAVVAGAARVAGAGVGVDACGWAWAGW